MGPDDVSETAVRFAKERAEMLSDEFNIIASTLSIPALKTIADELGTADTEHPFASVRIFTKVVKQELERRGGDA